MLDICIIIKLHRQVCCTSLIENHWPWCCWIKEMTVVKPMFYYYYFLKSYFCFILLYNTVLVLPYIDMNPPWVGEWHWNMYTIMLESNHQSMSDAGYSMLGAGARGWPRGMLWGGRWEGDSGLGTHVHPWRIHVNVWQNQYSVVK